MNEKGLQPVRTLTLIHSRRKAENAKMQAMLRKTAILALLVCCVSSALSQKRVALADISDRAASISTLAAPDTPAFHLKAVITETTNPDSDYKAEVEEYWVTPDKWKRTVKSPEFSQTVVVNGDKYFEQDSGEYYPQWLRELVSAIFQPLPMLEQLKQTKSEIMVPSGGAHSMSCARFESKVGDAPTQNSVFSVFCFSGSPTIVDSVVTPGYSVEFKDYKAFGVKRIARRLVSDPEPGTTIEAEVTEVSPLSDPDESLFAVADVTPPAERINAAQLPESVVKTLYEDTPAIEWPSIRAGKTSGAMSLYVCADRKGKVREVWPLNSDNAALDDAARAQVMKWKFKPAAVRGVPIQVESILTFPFNSKVENPIHVLTNEEARKLATHVVEAEFKPGMAPKGTVFTLRVSVGADGTILGTSNPNNVSTTLFLAGMNAVRQWKFGPYLRDGKPDAFDAEITFQVE